MKINVITALLSLFIICGCSDDTKTLHVYTWADYIDPDTISKFESDNRCRVVIDSFDSNEAMYSKLKAGASGYDIITPSSYIIPLLIRENIITNINHSLIPNVTSNFDHTFDTQIIDKDMKYSVPYLITYTGFLYSKEKCGSLTDVSWNIMTDSKFKGRFSILDDIRETIGAGLMYNGFSLNSTNKTEIDKSVEIVLKWRENTRKFDAESYKTEVSNGSSYFGHGYSSDSYQVIMGDGENSREDLGFTLPKEGFTIACDEFAIMMDSENNELAHKFINHMYETENSMKNMEYNVSPTPNKDAICKLDENMRKLIILDSETMKRGQVLKQIENVEVLDYYNKAWDKIRSLKK